MLVISFTPFIPTQIWPPTKFAIYMRTWFTYSCHNDQNTIFNSIDIWIYELLQTYLLLIGPVAIYIE